MERAKNCDGCTQIYRLLFMLHGVDLVLSN